MVTDDSSGADNNPNRDAAESMGVVKKVLDRAVTRFRNFGASEPEDVIVDGKRVYKGPLFRGFDPDTSNFGWLPQAVKMYDPSYLLALLIYLV